MRQFAIGLFCILLACNNALASKCPGDEMKNGWCWPTGTREIGAYLGYNSRNPDFENRKHLAQDIAASEGTAVYAIADGVVTHVRSDVGFYGGATCANSGIPGGGVIIRHKTATGKSFIALYAHLKNVHVGNTVIAGEKIGEVRDYTWCTSRKDHLHFAIRFPDRDDAHRWAGYEGPDGNHYGFVDPIGFLSANSPAHSMDGRYANKDDLAWQPADKPCQFASKWWRISDGTQTLHPSNWILLADRSVQSVDGYALCWEYNIPAQCAPDPVLLKKTERKSYAYSMADPGAPQGGGALTWLLIPLLAVFLMKRRNVQ